MRKTVRLRCAHDKYLTAEEDEESVTLDRSGSSRSAKWTVEFVDNSDGFIRLKSCYNKCLTASDKPFLLGMTGRKVLQTTPKRLDSSVEWEPVSENGVVKLKTRFGQFLRANGGLPPWRNSVTHDMPQRTATQECILWEVHVVEILEAKSSPVVSAPPPVEKSDSFSSVSSSSSTRLVKSAASFSWNESKDSFEIRSPPKGNGERMIYFHIANEHGEIDEGFEELCITFKGNDVVDLTKRLERELGIEGITVCNRSPLTGKLYPLRLHLPPNNATMHIIVVPASSNGEFPS